MKTHPGINPKSKPSGTGCVECLATDSWWLHLRRCAECGHIGCCDSSPNQHGSRHAAETGHPIAASFEPGEHWFWNYQTSEEVERGSIWRRLMLIPLHSLFPGQPARCRRDWESKLN